MEEHKISVNMSGKEFMAYKESRKIKIRLSAPVKRALPFFVVSFILLIFAIGMISNLGERPVTKPLFGSWYSAISASDDLSWSGLLRLAFLYSAPWLMLAVGIGWVIHGVGFHLVK